MSHELSPHSSQISTVLMTFRYFGIVSAIRIRFSLQVSLYRIRLIPFGSFATILSVILCIYESMVHHRKESSNFVFGTCVLHVSNWNLAVAKIIFVRHLRRKLDKCFSSLDLAPKVSCTSLVYISTLDAIEVDLHCYLSLPEGRYTVVFFLKNTHTRLYL